MKESYTPRDVRTITDNLDFLGQAFRIPFLVHKDIKLDKVR